MAVDISKIGTELFLSMEFLLSLFMIKKLQLVACLLTVVMMTHIKKRIKIRYKLS